MSDSLFSRHAAFNAGVVPATAEELSQRYVKLFQQYSRLKAQHTVLKKAVIKEQTSNVALQGNVKEKEKELRKLQEQLDLLAFHNERLTKRIEAVQDSDQHKGSHFSLLGGSLKKELEKNTQALEETKMDLERKIKENEKLHEELNERQFEFTQSINGLLQQIQNLEKKMQELQDENANLQQEKLSRAAFVNNVSDGEKRKKEEENRKDDYEKFQKEIEALKNELNQKTKLLDDKELTIGNNHIEISSEIQSLRAILLAKVGNLHGNDDKPLYDRISESNTALKNIEEEATAYFNSIKNNPNADTDAPNLPSEIADKLKLSSDTFYTEINNLSQQLDKVQAELMKLKEEKEGYQIKEKDLEKKAQQQSEKITNLLQKIETDQINHEASITVLQKSIVELENSNSLLKIELEEQKSVVEKARHELQKFKDKSTSKEPVDREVQVSTDHTVQESKDYEVKMDQESSSRKDEDEDNNSDVFVYPTPSAKTQCDSENKLNAPEKEDMITEEEEEVFIYRGMDAPLQQEDTQEPLESRSTESASDVENVKADNNLEEADGSEPRKIYTEEDMLKREEKLKSFYEQKVKTLTDKIQMTDGKAVRFAAMYRSLKERLFKDEEEKCMMVSEIERLNKEVKKVQDLLSTTESNYQTQIDTMTEFITSLQQTVEEQSRSQPPPQPMQARKHNNNINNIGHLHNNSLH
ncbi:hypothetical protein BDF20DRAFT_854187 [Mycotypha africana]|uniref:uncharacterized protein n=1 Tax=Mycotypha africana TaxID=64632 RepID=UPI00230181D4|nr:uncharacterized protein BDF20DRAFT_854187 [Mycotypha africana]KAI8988160.1 hypothetical protein BDF20DRAFT_854187 [Mycotypha africana]